MFHWQIEPLPDNICRLEFTGRLDAVTSDKTTQELDGKFDHTAHLLIDLGKLEYISSAGLRLLLLLGKAMHRHGGKMVICSLQPLVRDLFSLSGFNAIFTLAETREEAIELLKTTTN